jgi:hypothetical protein
VEVHVATARLHFQGIARQRRIPWGLVRRRHAVCRLDMLFAVVGTLEAASTCSLDYAGQDPQNAVCVGR